MLRNLQARARALKRETLTVYCAARDPRTPWLARGLAVLVVMYALSPMDLIPDFIPVLGLLDDVILVPLGVWLVLKLIPDTVIQAARVQAANLERKPVSHAGLAFIVVIWLAAAFWLGRLLWDAMR
jgi:uncharacterized membrane protein YkvA (DUF1232 family)